MGLNLHDLRFGNKFLVLIPKAQATKERNIKWTHTSKDIMKNMKTQLIGGNICKLKSNKGLIPRR